MSTRAGTNAPASSAAAMAATAAGLVAGAPVIGGGAPTITGTGPSLQLGAHANIRQSRTDRWLQHQWYLNRTDVDLTIVTDEDNNPVLGISKLIIEAPSVKQKAAGIVCKVSMESLTGMDYGITIWASKRNPGDIMLNTQGREYKKIVKGEEEIDWVRDRRLNDPTQAQILSFVAKHLA